MTTMTLICADRLKLQTGLQCLPEKTWEIGQTDRDREPGRQTGAWLNSPCVEQTVSDLVTLPQPEWSLSPSCSAESSPCHSTLLGSIPVWVYAGRHLSTRVTHSRNKTKACTTWELAISANTSQPARRNRMGDNREENGIKEKIILNCVSINYINPLIIISMNMLSDI